MNLLIQIPLRIALCAAATWWLYGKLELVALPICAPLFGVALARPILELLEASHGGVKRLALEPLNGRYYEHRGMRVDVSEDDDGQRWILAADARKFVGGLPRDEVLVKVFGEDAQASDRGLRVRAAPLATWLQKAQDASGVKFKVWLEREIVVPSRGR